MSEEQKEQTGMRGSATIDINDYNNLIISNVNLHQSVDNLVAQLRALQPQPEQAQPMDDEAPEDQQKQ